MANGRRRFRRYPKYRESDVDWLGKVPDHWVIDRFKSTVLGCQNGLWGDEPDGIRDIICVRVADFDRVALGVNMSEPTFRSFDEHALQGRLLQAGDLLLEKSGGGERQPVGVVVLYDHPEAAICSNFIARMPVRADFDARYLVYLHAAAYFARLNNRFIKQSTGIQNLDSASYLDEKVALPPLPEQIAIAAFLDREITRLDKLTAKKKRLIELLQEKHAALIAQAVTQGIDPNVPMKDSGVEKLKAIPAHWKAKRLWHLTPSDRQIMYGIVLPGPNVPEGVPIVKGGDVATARLKLSTLNRTAREIEASYERSRLRGGDLVIAIRGSIGDTAMIPDELTGANLTQDAARVAYGKETHGGWLLYALSSRAVFSQLEAGSLGATIKGINIRDLKRALIPVPPRIEQEAISAYLDIKARNIDDLVVSVREAIERLKELRSTLVSDAVTGKIDVREGRS
jgi:type I restriction enzyme S subunit